MLAPSAAMVTPFEERARPEPIRELTGPGGAAPATALADLAGLQVFSTVAHELRGPLMALATSAELLVSDLEQLPQAHVKEMVAGIHSRAIWLQGLVENLLCAAALRGGHLTLNVQHLNLLEVMHEVRQVIQPLLQRRRQRLRIRRLATAPLPEVHADGRRVGQVLVNLILNASKFGPPDAVIDLSLALRPGAVRLLVADRGPGLPPGQAARLFQPFYRGQAASAVPGGRPAPEGVGLGLAIVKEIVERHGGRVGAANRRGGGATFWFELPCAVAGQESAHRDRLALSGVS
ncbi:MAG TPA: ATP-binding protein [Chloroflexota bacterium]|nr:ATP-binding protein [Chloroflexota bacterium]